jgi:hypothetical protein
MQNSALNLHWTFVQWQNTAIHEYNNVKTAKIQDRQKFHPVTSK